MGKARELLSKKVLGPNDIRSINSWIRNEFLTPSAIKSITNNKRAGAFFESITANPSLCRAGARILANRWEIYKEWTDRERPSPSSISRVALRIFSVGEMTWVDEWVRYIWRETSPNKNGIFMPMISQVEDLPREIIEEALKIGGTGAITAKLLAKKNCDGAHREAFWQTAPDGVKIEVAKEWIELWGRKKWPPELEINWSLFLVHARYSIYASVILKTAPLPEFEKVLPVLLANSPALIITSLIQWPKDRVEALSREAKVKILTDKSKEVRVAALGALGKGSTKTKVVPGSGSKR